MTTAARREKYDALIHRCEGLPAVRTAVVHPCDEASLRASVAAAAANLIAPTFVGPEARIRSLADRLGIDIAAFELISAPHSHAAAERAVELVRSGRSDALMKGSLHTDELMSAVMRAHVGLQTGRRMSHVFVMDIPAYAKPLYITDAAVNIAPTLEDKADIVRNAIDLARALGVSTPKVAILSAVETVTSRIASTIDAAALCKMAERRQIEGGVLDGPLAFDNAIDRNAAATKHIGSAVAGDADVVVVPDLESGNMLAKALTYLAGADAAGLVLGATAPIVLTSRAAGTRARVASCAVALLYVHAWRAKTVLAAPER